MKRTFFFKPLAGAALVFSFVACQDRALPPADSPFTSRFVLSQTFTRRSGDFPPPASPKTTYYYNFFEDAPATLDKYQFSQLEQPDVWTNLSYSNQGRLTGMTETTLPANRPPSTTGQATFHYDGSNNLSSVNRSLDDPAKPAGNLALSETITFEYGPDKLPTKATSVASDGKTSYYVYTYTNGNVTRLDYTLPDGSTHSETLTYDDKPNPYQGMLLLRQSLHDLINTVNKNNFDYTPHRYYLTYAEAYLNHGTVLLNERNGEGVDETYQYSWYSYGM